MNSLRFILLVGSTLAAPQYNLPTPGNPLPVPQSPSSGCENGGVGCGGAQPEIKFYSFDPPQINRPAPSPADIPQPKVRHNIVFIKTSDESQQQDPIIIPQSQEKTLVYVLSKNQQQQQHQIQFEDTPAPKPEVYYVHYDEGDNVDLPGGYNLQSALASARSQQGQLIEGIAEGSTSTGGSFSSSGSQNSAGNSFGGVGSSTGSGSNSFGSSFSTFTSGGGSAYGGGNPRSGGSLSSTGALRGNSFGSGGGSASFGTSNGVSVSTGEIGGLATGFSRNPGQNSPSQRYS